MISRITSGKPDATLRSTAETVSWGWIAADRAPVLHVKSGQTVRIDKKSIEERRSLHSSSMPEYGRLLTPQQVADVVAWLMTLK